MRRNGLIAMKLDDGEAIVDVATASVVGTVPLGKRPRGIAASPDGTKLISSVQRGTLARIRPNQPAESIATGIPNAA